MTSAPELFKICLTNQGEDSETPWAHDLGPAPGFPPGCRLARLVNVPFMHAKPTWGDVIVVTPTSDGLPTWDRCGIPWTRISSKLVKDGGHWAMIVDYRPYPGFLDKVAFKALANACDAERLVCEGAWEPRDAEPGRAYVAAPKKLSAETVMRKLLAAHLPMQLFQIHPDPEPHSHASKEAAFDPSTLRVSSVRAGSPRLSTASREGRTLRVNLLIDPLPEAMTLVELDRVVAASRDWSDDERSEVARTIHARRATLAGASSQDALPLCRFLWGAGLRTLFVSDRAGSPIDGADRIESFADLERLPSDRETRPLSLERLDDLLRLQFLEQWLRLVVDHEALFASAAAIRVDHEGDKALRWWRAAKLAMTAR